MAIELQNRLVKQFRHLGKWARRQHTSCFRVYDHDLNDYPVVVDWLDGDVVAWVHPRKRDDTPDKQAAFLADVRQSLLGAFDIPLDRFWIKERRVQHGAEQYTKLGRRQVTKIVDENGIKFELNLSDYLDVGLFLDHRLTRSMVNDISEGLRVLNLFAYTGSFTCYAIAGGASDTVSVDLNPNYVAWIQRNLALNGVSDSPRHKVIESDCLHFLRHTRSEKFDIVVCDPPTFSNSKRQNASRLSIADDYPDLLNECIRVMSQGGVVIFSTNARRFQLDPARLSENVSAEEITSKTLSEDFRNRDGHRCFLIRRR